MTRVLLPILLAGTVLATWLSYLAGYSAGQREQEKANRAEWIRDIEVLRRAEDDRVQVDPRPWSATVDTAVRQSAIVAGQEAEYDRWLAEGGRWPHS